MKTLNKIFISLVVAVVLIGYLYVNMQNSGTEAIEYENVVVAKEKIIAGQKIAAEDLDTKEVPKGLVPNAIRKKEDIINKYAKDTLYKNEYIIADNIKTMSVETFGPDVREVRVVTNIAAYGGVAVGDKIDLIYVGKINAVSDPVGRILFEGLEVKSIMNRSGVDLELIKADKYNQAEQEPGYVTFWVEQEKALEIQTLQGINNDVVFKLSKWIDQSERMDQDYGVKIKEEILFDYNIPVDLENDSIGAIKDIIGDNNQEEEKVDEIGGDN